ncbi:MAG: cupredoxin domain-containing protein [Candidatus Nanohaloarchaea archaeon]
MRKALLAALLVTLLSAPGVSMVMNGNPDELPTNCDSISGWKNITVHAGREYAQQFNGKTFTYDERTLKFERCTKLTVTFVNNDSVRHQWMVHGLPWNVYPGGMFTIEVTGPGSETGTFILPAQDETFRVHCGVPQHQQKGMKAQLKVGEGDGKVSNVPGHTAAYDEYSYPRKSAAVPAAIAGGALLLMGILLSAVAAGYTEE